MGMCAIYQEIKQEDFKKLLESDNFFETIEELEEKDGTELCDIDKMWDALHFLLNGLSAIYGAPEDNLLSEFIIGSESFNDEAEEFARYIPTETVIEIAKKLTEINFQDYLKESPSGLKEIVKSKKVWNSDGTYLEDPDGKQFTYGKLLTLYTCKLEPYNRTLSYNRILVTGVQLKKERLDQAPKDVQKLFLDESGNLNVTGNSEVPKSESEASKTVKDNEYSSKQEDQNKPLEFKKIDSDEINWSDPLSFFANKQIKKDPDFMMKFFWGSFILAGITSLLSIYLPGKKGNKIDKKKQIEDGSEVQKILRRRGK